MTSDKRKEIADAGSGSRVHQAYMNSRAAYIEALNDSDNGYIRHTTGESTVQAISQTSIRGSTFLGLWWPKELYQKIKKVNFPAGKNYTYRGKAGILLDESHGCPIGCVRIESLEEDIAQQATNLGSTETDFGSSSSTDTFAMLQARIRSIQSKADDDDDTDGLKLTLPKVRTAKKDSDSGSEPDFLASAAGAAFGGGGMFGTVKGRALGRQISSSTAPPAKKQRGVGRACIQLKEVQAMEDVVGKAHATLELAATNFKALSAGNLASLSASIKKRLDEKNVDLVLSDNYDNNTDGKDMDQRPDLKKRAHAAIGRLREQDHKVSSMSAFMCALVPKKHQSPPTVDQLVTLYEELRLADVQCTSWPFVLVMQGLVISFIEEGNWSSVDVCLHKAPDTGCERIMLQAVSDDKKGDIQKEVVYGILAELTKVKEKTELCFHFVEHVNKAKLAVSDALNTEMQHLQTVLRISRLMEKADEDGAVTTNDLTFEDVPIPDAGMAASTYFKEHRDSALGGNLWGCYIVLVEAEKMVAKFSRDCALDWGSAAKLQKLMNYKQPNLSQMVFSDIAAAVKGYKVFVKELWAVQATC